jgi:hypothetical protein
MNTLKVKFEGKEGTFILAMEVIQNPHWGSDEPDGVEVWVLRRHDFYDNTCHEVVQEGNDFAWMMMAGTHWASHGNEMTNEVRNRSGQRYVECSGCIAYRMEAAKS